jgi:hypothetical protein
VALQMLLIQTVLLLFFLPLVTALTTTGKAKRGASCSSNSSCSSGLSCVDSICQLYWQAKTFSGNGFSSSWRISKDAFGSKNRKLVPDPAGTGETVMQITYPKGSMNPGHPGLPFGGTGVSFFLFINILGLC